MQQYFAINKNLDLDANDYHHIKNVMRMKLGDLIKVVYDETIFTCKIISLSDKVLFDVIDSKKEINKSVVIDVAFSLIKEQKLNYLLQKCTEVGVNKLIPINMMRSVVKIDQKKEKGKLDRWQKICKEASEQSYQNKIPKINEIINLKNIDLSKYNLKLLCSLNKNTKNIKKVLQKNSNCDRILLVVGPEGGFDPKEEDLLIKNGFISVSLGNNVLRAETAPVVALSMIKYEYMR